MVFCNDVVKLRSRTVQDAETRQTLHLSKRKNCPEDRDQLCRDPMGHKRSLLISYGQLSHVALSVGDGMAISKTATY